MSTFREGWYQTRFDPANYRWHCLYFTSPTECIAECRVEQDGSQILLWHEPEGRAALWSEDFAPLRRADDGDWWDNPDNDDYAPDVPGDYARVGRQPTARELCQRAATVDPALMDGLTCEKEIHVGIFFDGTNNNRDRDKPVQGHSNIASLYEAHKDDRETYFREYIPGVGTEFVQIGEIGENANGKTFASGGEARIHWAMMLPYNAVCAAVTGQDLMTEQEMGQIATSYRNGLATVWRLGDGKMIEIFGRLDRRLTQAIRGRRPRISGVNVSVFGFSRGAAQARVFCNWLQRASQGALAGAPLRLRFLGIFDTVASVGLADSAPIVRGLMDWADGNLAIRGPERSVHFVAAHEIRQAFPLSTARDGRRWPAGTTEFVYPGAHSDIGGGYCPGDQGKAMGERAALMSQIPLNDMYFEALNSGAGLMPLDLLEAETKRDLAVSPELDRRFGAYTRWTIHDEREDVAQGGESVENRMRYHMHLYWRWRHLVSPDTRFKALSSYTNASTQDAVDLWESELDWRKDVEAAKRAHQPVFRPVPGGVLGPRMVEVQPTPSVIERRIVLEAAARNRVPNDVVEFFDQHVHDSHAGFRLLGPMGAQETAEYIEAVKRKDATHRSYLERAASTHDPDAAVRYQTIARRYALNDFERRVLEADAAEPGSFPVMTDADAADMRDQIGFVGGFVVRRILGTTTRRESGGHGRYRRIFDRS